MTTAANIPKEVKFNDGRLYFTLDDKLYGSQSVVDGQDMYVNFAQSITPLATDAVEFTASISSDKVDLFKCFFHHRNNTIRIKLIFSV